MTYLAMDDESWRGHREDHRPSDANGEDRVIFGSP